MRACFDHVEHQRDHTALGSGIGGLLSSRSRTAGPVIDLSGVARMELECLERDGPPNLARQARIILARADGASLSAIGSAVGLHRDSVRRWINRFRERGVAGLVHGNAGKPKNVVFHPAVCNEIRRRAGMDPRALGENFPKWSLYKLRDHLMRHGVVRSVSVEWLRAMLRASLDSRRYWSARTRGIGPVPPPLRNQLLTQARQPHAEPARRARALLALADGASMNAVARRFRIGANSLRRWVRHLRLADATGLTASAPAAGPVRSVPEIYPAHRLG